MIEHLLEALPAMQGAEVVIYTRVSSKMQAEEGNSLETQLKICQELASKKGWIVVGHYSDKGISGRTTDRPAFKQMMDDAQNGKFKIIMTYKLDRLSRSVIDVILTMNTLDKKDIRFISATEPFNFTNPLGKLLLAIFGFLAEWFLTNLADNTREGHRTRSTKGHWVGQVPTGYYVEDYKKDGGDSFALIHEKDAEGMRLAFTTYKRGIYSDLDVALIVNEAGYRTKKGGLWTRDAMNYALQNPFYTGKVRFNEELHDGMHEPIITEALFNQCQEVRASRRVNRPKLTQKKKQRIYFLTGIAFCHKCGGKLHVSTSKISSGPKPQFFCSNRRQKKTCVQKYIDIYPIEKIIEEKIRRINLPPDWQGEIEEQAKEGIRKHFEEGKNNDIDVQRDKLASQLERLKNLYKWGDLTDKEYSQQSAEIKQKLSRLVPVPIITNERPDLKKLAEIIQNIEPLLQVANRKEKRQLIQTLISSIEIDYELGITKLVWTEGLDLILPQEVA